MDNRAILAAMTWATANPEKVGPGEHRELARVFDLGETEAVTTDRLQELDFASVEGLAARC